MYGPIVSTCCEAWHVRTIRHTCLLFYITANFGLQLAHKSVRRFEAESRLHHSHKHFNVIARDGIAHYISVLPHRQRTTRDTRCAGARTSPTCLCSTQSKLIDRPLLSVRCCFDVISPAPRTSGNAANVIHDPWSQSVLAGAVAALTTATRSGS